MVPDAPAVPAAAHTAGRHGARGAIASLVDTSVVPAVGTSYGRDAAFATTDLQVQYLGAASAGEDLIAVGWVTRAGRSVAFCRAEVVTDLGQPVVSGSLSFRISAAGGG